MSESERPLKTLVLDLKLEVASLQRRIMQLEEESQRRHAVLIELLTTPGGAQAYFSGAIPVNMPEVDRLFRKPPPQEPHSDS